MLRPTFHPCSHFVAIAATFLLAHGMRAELVKLSPFLPPVTADAPVNQAAPLQYDGWIESPEGRRFYVYDPAKKTGKFLKVGESDSDLDVTLKQYAEEHESITVAHAGQTLTLPVRSPKVLSGGAAPIPHVGIAPVPASPAAPAGTAQQLDAIAAEIARRRQMREQSPSTPAAVR